MYIAEKGAVNNSRVLTNVRRLSKPTWHQSQRAAGKTCHHEFKTQKDPKSGEEEISTVRCHRERRVLIDSLAPRNDKQKVQKCISFIEKKRIMKATLQVLALFLYLGSLPESNAWTPSLVSLTKTSSSKLQQQQRFYRLYVVDDKAQLDEDPTSDAFLTTSFSKNWHQPIPYSELTIGVLKETFPGENRVSQTPDSVKGLVNAGFTVVVEAGGTWFFPCLQ